MDITPYINTDKLRGEYQDKQFALIQEDTTLNASIPSSIRQSLDWLMRVVNSYYSNKIEGNSTHPKDLLKAQSYQGQDLFNIPSLSKDIIELLAHQEAQVKLKAFEETTICSGSFIKRLHELFYQGLPEYMLEVKDHQGNTYMKEDGQPLMVTPGAFRDRDVRVGQHIPPPPDDITCYMQWIERAYNPNTLFGGQKVLAAIALHHRLAWIHPFLDGNGRVIRLLTDCYMKKATGLGGYGLWSITRGFAIKTNDYYQALAEADKPRQGSIDGRGKLSDAGLMHFTEYFIDTALDQIRFFSGLFDAQKLNARIDVYFGMREACALPDDLPPIRIEARDIYKLLLQKGAMPRTDICKHIGKGEQTLRPVLKQMEQEGFISMRPKQDIKIKLSADTVDVLFPSLLK